ncbi:MAG TPA: hypothetical protein VGF07_13540, partial [Stellaceae bacterium]
RDGRHPHPGIYPDACSPQAWSASAILSLVQSMLGLLPLAPRETLIIDPDLPEWLPELRLDNIRVGSASVGLRFRRDKSGYTQHEIVAQEGRVRVWRPPAGVAGSDNLTRYIHEIAAA